MPEHLSADVSGTCVLSKVAEFSKALAKILLQLFGLFSLSRLNLIGFPNKFNRTPDINRIGSILSWNIHILPEHLSADVSSTYELSKLAEFSKALANIFTSTFWTFSLSRLNLIGFPIKFNRAVSKFNRTPD